MLLATAFAGVLVLVAGVLIGVAFRDSGNGNPLAGAIGGKFSLVDQNGKPFTDADLKGKWHLVFFGYTHCPDVCPTALNDLSLALDQLGAKKSEVGIVFISVDPDRDTPAVLKSYIESFGGPITGADRHGRPGQAGGAGLQGLLRQASDQGRRTTWTTAR